MSDIDNERLSLKQKLKKKMKKASYNNNSQYDNYANYFFT